MNVIQDLTDQRRQQREVLYLKDRADFMIEKNPALMFVFDPDLNVTKTNQAWADASGFSKEQLLSMNFTDFVVVDREGGSAKDVLKSGEETSGNVTFKAPKRDLHLRYFYVPLFDLDGNVDSILGVYFDETDMKTFRSN